MQSLLANISKGVPLHYSSIAGFIWPSQGFEHEHCESGDSIAGTNGLLGNPNSRSLATSTLTMNLAIHRQVYTNQTVRNVHVQMYPSATDYISRRSERARSTSTGVQSGLHNESALAAHRQPASHKQEELCDKED